MELFIRLFMKSQILRNHLHGVTQQFIITNMLESLHLKNFILVEDEVIDFNQGFNVLTGETGAGKSLILKSLALLAGQQASESYIREGADFSVIEAVFNVPKSMKISGFDLDNQFLTISRRIQRNRPTINKVNFESVSIKTMKDVMSQLLFMTSQHQVYELLDSTNHLKFFDQFIGEEVALASAKYQLEYKAYNELLQRRDLISGSENALSQEVNDLKLLVEDIDSKSFSVTEENDLTLQQKRCEDLQKKSEDVAKIIIRINDLLEMLSDLDNLLQSYNGQSSSSIMFDSLHVMDQLEHLNKAVSQERLELEYLEAIDLDEVNERLNEIFKYKVKYRVNSISELLELKTVSQEKINSIDLDSKQLQQLKEELSKQEIITRDAANELSKIRYNHQEGFEYIVLNQIKQLGMVDAKFELNLITNETFSKNGINDVSFQFSANPNTSVKPLKKVASGGELSRVMLALLVSNNFVLSQPIVILDEIDVGIGGVTANYIGDTLKKLSDTSQLLVITHLPQIARCAQHHYKIVKVTKNDESCVKINKLGNQDVITELQRMVGGDVITSIIK